MRLNLSLKFRVRSEIFSVKLVVEAIVEHTEPLSASEPSPSDTMLLGMLTKIAAGLQDRLLRSNAAVVLSCDGALDAGTMGVLQTIASLSTGKRC